MALAPAPVHADAGTFIWTDWYSQLTQYLNNGNSIPWSVINKSGSSLADLTTRAHSMLTSVQGGNATEQYHLTNAQWSLVTAAPSFTYSFNTRSGAVTLNSGDVTTALGYTPLSSINPGWTAYTPSVSALTGSYTTTSVTGAYLQLGGLVFFRVKLTITTVGTGTNPIIGVPFAANSGANSDTVIVTGRENALTGKMLQGTLVAGGTGFTVYNYDNTNPAADGAVCYLNGCYVRS